VVGEVSICSYSTEDIVRFLIIGEGATVTGVDSVIGGYIVEGMGEVLLDAVSVGNLVNFSGDGVGSRGCIALLGDEWIVRFLG
jgi:hypothetical protein